MGAGKLGSRHLQALSQINVEGLSLYVIDPSPDARSLAEARLQEMPKNSLITSVTYLESIKKLKEKNIDVAIIATTSKHRMGAMRELCDQRKIKHLILEKFLFQDLRSYQDAERLLQSHKIKAWVNLPRREWAFYRGLKKKLRSHEIQQVDVVGAHWSLATSAIHFIDLISFLVDEVEYKITLLDFSNSYVPSYSVVTGPRDSEYIEFYGSLHGRFSENLSFNFSCSRMDTPFSIRLTTDKGSVTIFEELGQCVFYSSDENARVVSSEINLTAPYQSELTDKVVMDILDTGNCRLTSYNEAAALHTPLLAAYLEYLNRIDPKFEEVCPIT